MAMAAHPAAVAARQLSEAFEKQAEAQAKQQRDFDQVPLPPPMLNLEVGIQRSCH